jgi:hypothetical protein
VYLLSANTERPGGALKISTRIMALNFCGKIQGYFKLQKFMLEINKIQGYFKLQKGIC